MTDTTKTVTPADLLSEEESSSINFAVILRMLILNWHWFVLSVIVCLGVAYVYLRYATPVYKVEAKAYIKNDGNTYRRAGNYAMLTDMTSMGMLVSGIENEMEVLKSSGIAEQTVKDLKLYTSYWMSGRIKDAMLYKDQPVTVDIDPAHVEKLNRSFSLNIERTEDGYHVTGLYCVPIDDLHASDPYSIDHTFTKLPATFKTGAGIITLSENESLFKVEFLPGMVEKVVIQSPLSAAYGYMGALTIEPTTKTSDVLLISLTDINIQRAKDYVNQMTICYNKQTNDDKNEISMRTEEFINDRLEKISSELGSTEGEIESYKRQNQLVELKVNAGQSVSNLGQYEQRLAQANTQMTLLDNLADVINSSSNKYEVLPANIGINDNTTVGLITTYNNLVLDRNRLLRTASENNPSVIPITAQLEDLKSSIRQALKQARRTAEIERSAISQQLNQYSSEVYKTPEQERVLTQIGRQQDIKSDLYLTLLQKREENSINLAATSDKTKLIEAPQYSGKVSPKNMMIYAVALVLGLMIPALFFFCKKFFRYRIEGHDDVAQLVQMPILADIAVANETTKTKGDIVVHANKNNTMEEVFRSLRTNVHFMLGSGKKTILVTSSISGEGKTFVAANLAMSFALLDKKVVVVGLDIRKPRLAELFEIDNHHNGITPLLALDNPTWLDVHEQIVPSDINNNLDLLLAGPVPPNPAELIAKPSLDTIIRHLEEHYDYVILDTAPVGLVTDTLLIGRCAALTIIICRADFTPKRNLASINELAKENKLPNVAFVINGIDMSKRKHQYAYGYSGYGRLGNYIGYGGYGYGGKYGSHYGTYGSYGQHYGQYGSSHYGSDNDDSVKLKKSKKK